MSREVIEREIVETMFGEGEFEKLSEDDKVELHKLSAYVEKKMSIRELETKIRMFEKIYKEHAKDIPHYLDCIMALAKLRG